MIEDRGSMIATHDRGQDVRKQEVLQRVPLNPGALIIDPLNHTNEPFWIGKRGTPLRVGKHLHGDEHFDEVLELPPPIGIERLPLSNTIVGAYDCEGCRHWRCRYRVCPVVV